MLRETWNVIDTAEKGANRAKAETKLAFKTSLLLGTAIASLSVIAPMYPDIKDLGPAIVGLSLISSLVTSFVIYRNPKQRWEQLRAAALLLESEVWQFRTRTCSYGTSLDIAKYGTPKDRLCRVLNEMRVVVLEKAGVKQTTFLHENAKESMAANIFKHGQYDFMGLDQKVTNGKKDNKEPNDEEAKSRLLLRSFDTHHSPLEADAYVTLRLDHFIRFYQRRLPHNYRNRTIVHMLLVLGTLVNALLAFIGQVPWVALVTVISSGVTSWSEFAGSEKKLERYSSGITTLKNLKMYWESLDQTSRANTQSIDHLVKMTEDIIGGESRAWLATSQSAKSLAEPVGEQSSGVENKKRV